MSGAELFGFLCLRGLSRSPAGQATDPEFPTCESGRHCGVGFGGARDSDGRHWHANQEGVGGDLQVAADRRAILTWRLALVYVVDRSDGVGYCGSFERVFFCVFFLRCVVSFFVAFFRCLFLFFVIFSFFSNFSAPSRCNIFTLMIGCVLSLPLGRCASCWCAAGPPVLWVVCFPSLLLGGAAVLSLAE